ncbi:hypothetical protein PAPYR_8017 [Paratrimastix pyriformis]|uniref:Uncharacterized protein n=1 Tax=Paratrimastix pyriformis TaxID=342808 RepID=A0ABQ8UH13_9EUKA|nr:hypothetical protein PAPYR_8017 [Paratrimastix pyriformis]
MSTQVGTRERRSTFYGTERPVHGPPVEEGAGPEGEEAQPVETRGPSDGAPGAGASADDCGAGRGAETLRHLVPLDSGLLTVQLSGHHLGGPEKPRRRDLSESFLAIQALSLDQETTAAQIFLNLLVSVEASALIWAATTLELTRLGLKGLEAALPRAVAEALGPDLQPAAQLVAGRLLERVRPPHRGLPLHAGAPRLKQQELYVGTNAARVHLAPTLGVRGLTPPRSSGGVNGAPRGKPLGQGSRNISARQLR